MSCHCGSFGACVLFAMLVPRATAGKMARPSTKAPSRCTTNEDCLLLGTCDPGGVCRCWQGFAGPECGQLDLDDAPSHLGYRNLTASTWGGLPVRARGAWHLYVSMIAGDCPLGTVSFNSPRGGGGVREVGGGDQCCDG